MRRIQPAFLRLALLLAVALTSSAGAAAPAIPQYPVEDFISTVNVAGASFSPDTSKILFSSDASGVFNAYSVPFAGGEPTALTTSTTDGVFALSYFPTDERFLYSSDRGGNELTHLYVRELDGRSVDLTPGEKLKAQFAGWATDDRSFFVETNERNPQAFDLYEIMAEGYQRSLIYQNDEGYEFVDVAPDRRYVALSKEYTGNDSDLFLHDRATGVTKNLTQHQGEIRHEGLTFSRDGKSLYLTTDEGSEFPYLVRMELATGQRTEVLRTDWPVLSASLTKKGDTLVVLINRDARSEIRVLRVADGSRIEIPNPPGLDIGSVSFSRDGRKIAFYANASRAPRNLYAQDFPAGTARRLTNTLSPKLDPAHLAEGQVVRFKSFDGVEIPGILYKPLSASPENKVPALVVVHGGPGGQSRIGYDGMAQFLVNHGYALFFINNRGSSGYGKTFFAMDDRNHGEGDLDDCVASKSMLAATGWIDAGRIGIMGGSYGGYMTAAALAFRPTEFAVGVNIFGVTNWLRTLKSIPAWWGPRRASLFKEMGDPTTDEEYLRKISPLFHAKNIVRPLLVIQGANDPRVLKVESDEIVAAVKANGVPVEYVVFDDEGHGFRKKENSLAAYRAILAFLERYLRGGAPAKPAP